MKYLMRVAVSIACALGAVSAQAGSPSLADSLEGKYQAGTDASTVKSMISNAAGGTGTCDASNCSPGSSNFGDVGALSSVSKLHRFKTPSYKGGGPFLIGKYDYCSVAYVANAEDGHYCNVYRDDADGNWYMRQYKTGCTASCFSI